MPLDSYIEHERSEAIQAAYDEVDRLEADHNCESVHAFDVGLLHTDTIKKTFYRRDGSKYQVQLHTNLHENQE